MPITKTVSRWTGLRRRAWDDGDPYARDPYADRTNANTAGVSVDMSGGTGAGVTLRLSGGGPVGLDFNSSTGGVEIGYRF